MTLGDPGFFGGLLRVDDNPGIADRINSAKSFLSTIDEVSVIIDSVGWPGGFSVARRKCARVTNLLLLNPPSQLNLNWASLFSVSQLGVEPIRPMLTILNFPLVFSLV
jgi:hypothetical protein